MRSSAWEYRDFVYALPAGGLWVNCGRLDHPDVLAELFPRRPASLERGVRPLTFAQAKEYFWCALREEILAALQPWINDGWEPGDEIGAAGITLRSYKSFKTYPVLRPLLIVLSVVMIGLPLFWRETVVEPDEFRLLMRRRKN